MGAEGVKWISNNSSPTLARYHGAAGSNTLYSPANQAAATTYFNALAPWGATGRVSLRPDGSVSSRCNVNTTSLQTGDNCYSDTDDSGGEQKMVYIPRFCYAVDTLTANQVWWWVGQIGDTFRLSDNSANYTFTTTNIHPAFIVDSMVKEGAYVGAYEAYNSSSVLKSVAGVTPTESTTPTNFRTYAQANGAGWELMTIQAMSMLKLLYIIEYANLASQSTLGYGYAAGTIQNTGTTTTYGNASYGDATYTHNTSPLTYRGVENLYGNMYTLIEGINIKGDYMPWIAPQTNDRTTHPYAWGAFAAPYVDTTITVPSGGGFITAVDTSAANGWAFLPSVCNSGSNSTYFADYLVTATSTRLLFMGSAYNNSNVLNTGLFYIGMYATTQSAAGYGARIQYLPQ
jgi:hypothetical protein